MNKKAQPQSEKSIADIAREAFRLLGSRRAAPTPDAYRAAFYEVAGITPPEETPKASVARQKPPEKTAEDDKKYAEAIAVLEDFAQQLTRLHDEVANYGHQLLVAIQANDFKKYEKTLGELARKYFKPPSGPASLVDPEPAKNITEELRELLVRTLSFGLTTLLHDAPELANEAENLGETLKTAQEPKVFEDATKRLKQLCFKIEMKGASSAEQQELLLRLFRLLLNNIGELLEDDSWLRGQIDVMQELISGPVSFRALEDTESSLKEVIYKQGLLKHSLNEAKESIKQMMISFIERLGFMTESTGNYHDRIKVLSEKVSKTNNVIELNSILENIMYETNAIQTDTLVSLNQMQSTRKRVEEAETRVKDLENQLEQMSELVREDKLTGSLNRRGLEDAFDREIARSERNNTPLCVALLDLDNFKMLNDTHGHLAGDDALIHLVRVVKQTLRPTDVIARYGGEEFVILLPETQLNDGIFTMQRLQRELTKHFFMHNNERILITFSAGVALRRPGEDWDAVTHRADKAMYAAKKSGKNRVLSAE
ncbi:diguanylate cyclase [Oxalobacter sp. OttesenSCG-928-P03]|nr:diguanylate cyclase [Oxalobacter sp. OttesenSCG-928-P03]